MALIKIEGMTFFAQHGCFTEERIIGNKFILDVCFESCTQKAEISDNLEDTVDYQEVYNAIKKEMEIPSNLLEHVARRIINAIKENFTGISHIQVKIAKCYPPIGDEVKSVSVVIYDES